MTQTDLIPTTNTLSGINDTIAQLTESLNDPNLVNAVVEQVSNGGSSRQIGLTIAIIGLLIFTAHLFSEIFSRKRIPDVLFLIIIGLLIGPVFHWISPDSLGNAGSLFSGITLVTILFESGTQLRFSALKDSFKGALKLTALNFVLSAVATWLVGWLVLKLDPIVSMILGCMLGGTASAVVIPIVRQMHMSEKPAIMLILEAAIGNVFSIVLALALMQAIQSRHVEFGAILGDIFSSFILFPVTGQEVGLPPSRKTCGSAARAVQRLQLDPVLTTKFSRCLNGIRSLLILHRRKLTVPHDLKGQAAVHAFQKVENEKLEFTSVRNLGSYCISLPVNAGDLFPCNMICHLFIHDLLRRREAEEIIEDHAVIIRVISGFVFA